MKDKIFIYDERKKVATEPVAIFFPQEKRLHFKGKDISVSLIQKAIHHVWSHL